MPSLRCVKQKARSIVIPDEHRAIRHEGWDRGQRGFSASPAALSAANIHPATGLATDYLNHFNEITMLIGLLPSMPEVLDDIRVWKPASYVEHFARSGFKERALAISTYHEIPDQARDAFEATIAAIDEAILDAVARFETAPASGYSLIAFEANAALGPLMARASGMIHGVEFDTDLFAPETTQGTVDALLI
jgi:hypothetical protein